MTLEQAKNLREPDLIEVNYRGNWLRHNFKKLESGKVLIGNLALIKLEDCRLIPIKEKHLESFRFEKSHDKWVGYGQKRGEHWQTFELGDHVINKQWGDPDRTNIPENYYYEKNGIEIDLKYVHELIRYCKENNIEGKGWR